MWWSLCVVSKSLVFVRPCILPLLLASGALCNAFPHRACAECGRGGSGSMKKPSARCGVRKAGELAYAGNFAFYMMRLPNTAAISRSSPTSFSNWVGVSCWGPSDRAAGGLGCTSIMRESAPAATAA